MKIRPSTVRAQFEKCDAFEPKTNNRPLLGVAISFVPETAFCGQQIRVLTGELKKIWTSQSILAFNNEAQRDRHFAKRLLIRFYRYNSGQEVTFAIRGATGI